MRRGDGPEVFAVEPPYVPGSAVAGTVTAIGAGGDGGTALALLEKPRCGQTNGFSWHQGSRTGQSAGATRRCRGRRGGRGRPRGRRSVRRVTGKLLLLPS
ncbi:hypothetical protein ACPZ19_28745 [Amycolatopsis lurida]